MDFDILGFNTNFQNGQMTIKMKKNERYPTIPQMENMNNMGEKIIQGLTTYIKKPIPTKRRIWIPEGPTETEETYNPNDEIDVLEALKDKNDIDIIELGKQDIEEEKPRKTVLIKPPIQQIQQGQTIQRINKLDEKLIKEVVKEVGKNINNKEELDKVLNEGVEVLKEVFGDKDKEIYEKLLAEEVRGTYAIDKKYIETIDNILSDIILIGATELKKYNTKHKDIKEPKKTNLITTEIKKTLVNFFTNIKKVKGNTIKDEIINNLKVLAKDPQSIRGLASAIIKASKKKI